MGVTQSDAPPVPSPPQEGHGRQVVGEHECTQAREVVGQDPHYPGPVWLDVGASRSAGWPAVVPRGVQPGRDTWRCVSLHSLRGFPWLVLGAYHWPGLLTGRRGSG